MTVLFSPEETARLRAPHIARAWFALLDLPSGPSRLHSGVGRVQAGGYEWRGVTDPVGGRLLSLEGVEEPAFGQAAAVTITLSGADIAFLRSVDIAADAIEGRLAELSWAMFDGETQEIIGGLKKLFPRGRMSAPQLQWQGLGRRIVSLTIESAWSSQNFPPGGRWNGADQRRRHAGDKGLDFVGVKIEENWI
jgi:hypothetical protein